MSILSRRSLILGAGALVAACDNSIGSGRPDELEQQVRQTISSLQTQYPATQQMIADAAGMLVLPKVGEASFMLGGSYGEGALVIDNVIVDYYQSTQASVGLQVGAQEFSYVLFFMTPEALRIFRTSPGWTAGADVEYTFDTTGGGYAAGTDTQINAIRAVVFDRSGLRVGASLAGTKYTRFLP